MNRNIKRIMKDINDIKQQPIDNIYYMYNDDNITKGYTMIIGPKDTPYEYGFYFFEFIFPDNYPFLPPKVLFRTFDGKTRFNPNLYVNGYVCLSLLNTWPGEQWSSCQSIRTILLNLMIIFNDKPLLNEPGVTIHHKDFQNYNKIIHYRNFEVCLLQCLNIDQLNDNFRIFYPIIKKEFIKYYAEIIKKAKIINKIETISTGIYDQYCVINYNNIIKLMEICYNELIKIDK